MPRSRAPFSVLPHQGREVVPDLNTQRAFNGIIGTIQMIQQILEPFAQVEPWKGISLLTGWRNYSDPALQVTQYRKTPLGRIELRGVVERFSGITTAIATLPAGYRPKKRKLFPVVGSAGPGVVSIYADGLIEYTSGGTTYLSLEGITFDTES